MANWYDTREGVKRELRIEGSERNSVIDRHIASASREIERLTNRRFIPITETRNYTWPQRDGRTSTLYLDEDLIAVDTLTKDDDAAVAIGADDFLLEPANTGPPYWRIEIDRSSSEFFSFKNTTQRAIRVTGRWGYSEDTEAAGTVASGLASSSSATTFVCSNAALIDVGDTLLIESEQLWVSERVSAAEPNNDLLDGVLTKDISETSVTVDDGSRYNPGEVILVDSERMFIDSISGNVLAVQRAYDGTLLAAHSNNAPVSVFRTLTVQRGLNGTTAATHANAKAITRYLPPEDIRTLCRALAIYNYGQGGSGWTGAIGGGEAVVETRGNVIGKLRDRVKRAYKRRAMGTV